MVCDGDRRADRPRRHHGWRRQRDRRRDDVGRARGGVVRLDGDRAEREAPPAAHRGLRPVRAGVRPATATDACLRAGRRAAGARASRPSSWRRDRVDARGTLPRAARALTWTPRASRGRLGVDIGLDEVGTAPRRDRLRRSAATATPFGDAPAEPPRRPRRARSGSPTSPRRWRGSTATRPCPHACPRGRARRARPRSCAVRRDVREALVGLGALEAWTATIVAIADAALVGDDAERVRVTNPVAADEPVLRSSLLPGLLGALRRNVERRQGDVALFEVGTVFTHPRSPTTPRLERGGGGGDELLKVPSEDERVCARCSPSRRRRRPRPSPRGARSRRRCGSPTSGSTRTRDDRRPRACTRRGGRRCVDAQTGAVLGVVGEVRPGRAAARCRASSAGRRLGWLDVSLLALGDPAQGARRDERCRLPERYPIERRRPGPRRRRVGRGARR